MRPCYAGGPGSPAPHRAAWLLSGAVAAVRAITACYDLIDAAVPRRDAAAANTEPHAGYWMRMSLSVALRHGLPKAAARIPGLKRLPVLNLLRIGELALVARRHLQLLDSDERQRLARLVRRGPRLSAAERDELQGLVAKLDVRAFAGSAVQRISPVPLPRRLTRARY